MNRHLLLVSPCVLLCVGAASSTPVVPAARHLARATIQELMQSVIDPAADGVWNAVETTTDRAGDTVREPRTDAEWREVRRAAMTLAAAADALLVKGRRVAVHDFPAEATGALNSAQIQERVAARRPTFNAFADALRAAARTSLAAIDARDASALVEAGGQIDQVCEGCHLAFWYPNQVIPPLPGTPAVANFQPR